MHNKTYYDLQLLIDKKFGHRTEQRLPLFLGCEISSDVFPRISRPSTHYFCNNKHPRKWILHISKPQTQSPFSVFMYPCFTGGPNSRCWDRTWDALRRKSCHLGCSFGLLRATGNFCLNSSYKSLPELHGGWAACWQGCSATGLLGPWSWLGSPEFLFHSKPIWLAFLPETHSSLP
jgi:hypothetical protein